MPPINVSKLGRFDDMPLSFRRSVRRDPSVLPSEENLPRDSPQGFVVAPN